MHAEAIDSQRLEAVMSVLRRMANAAYRLGPSSTASCTESFCGVGIDMVLMVEPGRKMRSARARKIHAAPELKGDEWNLFFLPLPGLLDFSFFHLRGQGPCEEKRKDGRRRSAARVQAGHKGVLGLDL